MKSLSCGIYMITNDINGKMYIGQSNNVFSRWSEHYKIAYRDTDKNYTILYRAIRKYGIENFNFRILELCDKSELDEKEKYYIDLYDAANGNNYNICLGGSNHTPKGEYNKNSKLTEEDVYNIRESYKNIEKKREVYKKYSDKISINTFADVWVGKTWNHIHMDVYTEENKQKQRNNYDKMASHKTIRTVSDKEVLDIRRHRKNEENATQVYKEFYSYMNRNTFNDVWYGHTFKHITA